MNSGINYKQKYLELRSKYINDLDLTFRLGVEQGQQMAQKQQADSQAQQLQSGDPNQASEQSPQEAHAGSKQSDYRADQQMEPKQEARGTELDSHIAKLEGMLGSKAGQDQEIQKSILELLTLAKSEKQALEFAKAEKSLPGIIDSLHKPSFKMGVNAAHNMDLNAKKALTLQHEIVNDVFKSWESEEQKTTKDIKSIVKNLIESAKDLDKE